MYGRRSESKVMFCAPQMTYPDEAAVRMLEVHDGGPIIGFVFLESACRTGRHCRKIVIGVHGDVESEDK